MPATRVLSVTCLSDGAALTEELRRSFPTRGGGALRRLCTRGGRVVIDQQYVRKTVLPRTTALVLAHIEEDVPRRVTRSGTSGPLSDRQRVVGGMLLAHRCASPPCLFIDVLCAAPRLGIGPRLVQCLGEHAAAQGIALVALRAVDSALVDVYARPCYGFGRGIGLDAQARELVDRQQQHGTWMSRFVH